jgi:two-component system NtrC family sensor kinase
MAGNGLTGRLMATIVVMLGLAMALQSMVLVYFGASSAIREEVAAARRVLHGLAEMFTAGGGGDLQGLAARISAGGGDGLAMFSCLAVTPAFSQPANDPPCAFAEQHRAHAKTALAEGRVSLGVVGNHWNIFFLNREGAVLAVPLRNAEGDIVGALSAERSFAPIYQRYREELQLAAVYLAVNLVIFAILVFFRLDRSLFRPLNLLLRKSEEYHPDQVEFFPIREGDTVFRRLSLSFHGLLQRIESDNRKLRATVSQLEEANQELRQRNEMVVRSEKLATAGRLSAGLAHEIGNPLSIIQGYAELLARADLGQEERQRFSDKAQQELDRIKRLIGKLLDFARPGEREPVQVAVHNLLDDVVAFLSVEKNFAGCRVRREYLATDDRVVVDRDALRQVLINCLLNALDAVSGLSERQAELMITTVVESGGPSGRTLVVRVADNGSGITAEDLPNIFDPFFTTKEGGRGTGLGLFVCHTIMERLGGTIAIFPLTPLDGVEVRLTLPLSSEEPSLH